MSENKSNNVLKEKTAPEINPQDALNHRLDEIELNLKGTIDRQNEVIEAQNKTIEELKNRPVQSSDKNDEAILVTRQSAHTMRLPVVNGAPVIDGKLERVLGIQGLEYIINVKTADNKTYKFPFGCDVGKINFGSEKLKDIEPVAYENVKTQNFKLQDIDTNDLTGASKVEKGKIVSEGNVIPEVDRSSGRPIMTGRKIRTVVLSDIRHYTIEYNGKKFTFTSDQLGGFRI